MHYRRLGTTGCTVSTYALGTMTFGVETPREEAFAQLDLFAESGGTFLDCADVYGAGRSETIVGEWLADRPADLTDPVVIATKGRFLIEGEEGASRRHLRRALEASLRRLGRDHVDVYMPHAWDPLTPVAETLRFLDDAVTAGTVVYPAVSNYLGWQLQKAVDLAEGRGWAGPVAVQVAYSLLVREIEWEVVPAAQHNGLGVLAWSPLGGGWLTGKYRRETAPTGATRLGEDPGRGIEAYERRATDRTWAVLEAVEQVARAREASMAQVALAWTAQRPAVSAVLLGARTVEQLRDNLAAAELALTGEEMAALDAVSAPVAADWPYGQPGVEQRTRRVPG